MGRLLRVALILRTRPPHDPRQNLYRVERLLASQVLTGLAADPPVGPTPDQAVMFDAIIRPRLRSWLVYERRREAWREREAGRVQAINLRRLRRSLAGGRPREEPPVFAGKVKEVVLRMLGMDGIAATSTV